MNRSAVALAVLLIALPSPCLHATEPTPSAWVAVTKTSGELAFVHDLAAYALACPMDDFAPSLTGADALPAERRQIARTILIAAWVERDADTAIASRQSAGKQWTADDLVPFYQALAGLSPDRALRLIAAENDPMERVRCFYFTLQKLAATDPAKVVPAIREHRLAEGEDGPWFIALWGELSPPDALQATLEHPASPERNQLQLGVLHGWLGKDPAAPFAWIAGHLENPAREEFSTRLAQALAHSDWNALRKLADDTRDPALRAILEKAAIDSLAWQGAAALWEHVRTKGWDGVPDHALSSLAGYAAKLPKAEAVEFFRGIPPRMIDGEYASDAISEPWALIDPDSALAWARGLPDASLRDYTLLHINSMLTELDFDFAIAQIEQTPQGPLQTRLIRNTALALGKTDLPPATDWVLSLPAGAAQNEAVDALALIAARTRPDVLATHIKDLPAGPVRTRLIGQLASHWLKEDIPAATAWVLALPDGPERAAALRPAMDALARQSPEEAIAMAPTVTDPAERAHLIRQLAEHQAANHIDAVLALIDTLPDGSEKTRTRDQALRTLAKDDPVTMSELIVEGSFGRPTSSVVGAVLDNWKGSTESAGVWVKQLLANFPPDQTSHARAYVSNFVNNWTRTDHGAARAWVESLPESNERTGAVDALAIGTSRRFPAEGFAIAVDLDATDRGLRETVNALSRSSPEQVEALIRNSLLTEARKQKALSWIAR